MLIVSGCYVLCLLALWQVERIRSHKRGPKDLLSIFLMLFVIQLMIPGVVITALSRHVRTDTFD